MKFSGLLTRLLLMLLASMHPALGDDVAPPDYLPPVVGDYSPTSCWNFTHGNWQHGEFYSPHYPDNYPNDTDCIQTLIAPRGYKIHLDFRDDFHIEAVENCKYDFLEFHDGPFGYSPLIGRYCGKKHPPMIKSSSRFLWIRFKADESIEYDGFRAVYYFSPMNGNDYPVDGNYSVCRIQVDIAESEGIISSSDMPQSYLDRVAEEKKPIDCTWVIYAPPKQRVFIQFHEYDIFTVKRCQEAFIEIYDRTTAESDRQKLICGDNAKDQRSLSNHFYLRLFKKKPNLIVFQALFTIYLEKGQDISCPDDLYDCGPGDMCINRTLLCNHKGNCGTNTDENEAECEGIIATPTSETSKTSPTHHLILGVVSGIILTIILVAIGVTCHQKRQEDKRKKHALKQEEKIIELTTLLNKPSPGGSPSYHRRVPIVPRASSSMGSLTHIGNGGSSPKMNHVNSRKHMPNHTNGVPLHKGRYRGSQPLDFDVGDVDGTTFKRYLDVGSFTDEDSSPVPSTCNQIPAIVTIENPKRRISYEDVPPHEKSSPRPDIINEDKFTYSVSKQEGCQRTRDNPRRFSGEAIYSEKSDIWKPTGLRAESSMPNHKPGSSQQSLPRETNPVRTIHRVTSNPRLDITPRVPQRTDSILQTTVVPVTTRQPERKKAFTPPDTRKTYVGQDMRRMHRSPEEVRPSRSKTPELARSFSAGYSPEMEHRYSPETKRAYAMTSPVHSRPSRSPEYHRPKKVGSPGRYRADSPGRRKAAGSKSPDIFFTRPNRSIKQHHPV